MDFPVNVFAMQPPGDEPTKQQLAALHQAAAADRPPPEEYDLIDEVPKRVRVALTFIEMCNDYTHPKALIVGQPHVGIESSIQIPELPGPQSGALQRACVCLGRYFDGQDVDEPPDYLLDDEDFTDDPGSSPEPNGGSGY
jgi:hypothetical protein